MKKLTIGILAHVDSGKTTLSESMLYYSGKIIKVGRVDHKDAFLDTHDLEKNRGITIFSKQARFNIGDTVIDLLDTPGHVDFSTEMERTLQVIDYAILVISGANGTQAHTETLWALLSRYKIPCFIFVNKMDLAGTDKSFIMKDLQDKLSVNCIDFEDKNYMENVAMCSDSLTEEFLLKSSIPQRNIARAIKNREVYPCFFGSALKLEGTENFIEKFDEYTIQDNYGDKFGARVFKIAWDNQGNRLSYMKICSGSLKVRTVIYGTDQTQNSFGEKVNQIRVYNGVKFTAIDEAMSGDVVAVTGLNSTYVGQGLGTQSKSLSPMLEPVLTYKINLPNGIDAHTALSKFKILQQEDPQLNVVWNERYKEIHIQLMGVVQLEILQSIVKDRFDYDITFDSGSIVYKETIQDEVIGSGHFEPLKHYAEVHLKLEPSKRGSGLIIDNKTKTDDLDKNWQNLILSHLIEKNHIGALTGSSITDMRITLIAGRGHLKHTEGGDFRQATYRALRQGLMEAKSVILEPFYEFTLTVPVENMGRAMNDIQLMHGSFKTPQNSGDSVTIKGEIPVSTSMDYLKDVISYTKGKGKFNCKFKGYDQCHNEEQVIRAINYQAEADLENTGDSVFCSHGAGYPVKWSEAKSKMHIKPEDKKDEEQVELKARRVATSRPSLYDDKEILKIFENTYGKVKTDPRVAMQERKKPAIKTENYKRTKQIPTGPEYVLVDGYNVIFAWEELSALSKINIDGARNKLVEMLINYKAYKKCEVIVVFDAYKVKGNTGSTEKEGNISIVYTKEAETADMYIEKVTHAMAKNYRVRVVTSDALEQMIIMGHGALRTSANAFKDEVMETENNIREILDNQNK
ncbi:MAG: translation factor GTPase family protein [Clostridia bacterium]